MRRAIFPALLCTSLAGGGLGACTPDLALVEPSNDVADAAAPPPDAGLDADAAERPSLAFSACPGAYSGACTTVEMPLDWSNPNGKKIGILIDKIASVANPKRQVWLLQGGPGGSAAGMVGIGADLANRLGDAEILTIEHRGVGASNRLGCPTFEAAHADGGGAPDGGPLDDTPCFEEMKTRYAAELPFYTVTNAARDLANAIELARRPGVPVFVYGVSYGTLWAQRFMQVAPNAAAGVVLDSLVVPDFDASRFSEQADSVVVRAAEECKLDGSCSAALGPDPWARIQAIKAKLAEGHCPSSGLTDAQRGALVPLVQARMLLGYAFAFWHRFDRCTPEDAAAIKGFLGKRLFNDPTAGLFSPGLYANVLFSEMWASPAPSDAEMKDRYAKSVFAGIDGVRLAALQATWPKYPLDDLARKYPTSTVPLLVLAGTYDAQTIIERQEEAKAKYTAPNQTFVVVPKASHAVIAQSPTAEQLGGPPKICGAELVAAFLANPTAPLDTSCTTRIAPIDFARPDTEVSILFGTDDMWLGAPRSPGNTPASLDLFDRLPRFPLLH